MLHFFILFYHIALLMSQLALTIISSCASDKIISLKIYKFLEAYIRMEKVIKLGDIEIQKQKFHQHKEPISVKDIDINKIVVSNKVSFGKKRFEYFIGYRNAKKQIFMCISRKNE